MHHSGLLVASFPAVLGCDASGVVLEIGEGVTRFKEGDAVLGCTRLGTPGHSTFQETFLMAERTSVKQVGNAVTLENGATIGVGLYVSSPLYIDTGLGLTNPTLDCRTRSSGWDEGRFTSSGKYRGEEGRVGCCIWRKWFRRAVRCPGEDVRSVNTVSFPS
jgi:hypothetical protein